MIPGDKQVEPTVDADGDTRSLGERAAAQPELARVLEEYMASLEKGQAPDRDRLLREHPEIAGLLSQCLSAIEFIHGVSGRATGGSSPAIDPNTARLGDFRILREIGSGGMGVVYEAEQVSLGRRVALKVLRFGPAGDAAAMRRFQREAETVAALHHTNIVPVHAVGEERGVHYFAMQLIDGRNVGDVAEDATRVRKSLDISRVAGWGLQAAEALAHAHARGVIHRDVKPSNLLLDREGRVWLTDFGLARRLDDVSLSLTGMLLGTPRYMSPEQAAASGAAVDHRSDVYSLGATLYELVTGRPAFDADTAHRVIADILGREPEPPRRIRPDVPLDLETIVLRCLSKAPGRRYQTADELAEDLRAFLEGRDIRARRPGPVERLIRRVRRPRRTAIAAALAAASSVAIVVGAWLGWSFYEKVTRASLLLETRGERLVAELIGLDGAARVSGIAVPGQEPVEVPAGSYRLRLLAPGLPSETWPLELRRGEHRTLAVGLRRRWLWPPMELRPDEYPELETVSIEGRADLVVVTREPVADRSGLVTRIRRVDGVGGRPLWSRTLEESSAPSGRDPGEWRSLLDHSGLLLQDRLLVEPAVDLSGDGIVDLVWLGRTTPSLLALSGRDGSTLWWFRGRPSLSEPPGDRGGVFAAGRRSGALVGRPALADVDGDGTGDLVACLVSSGETLVTPAGSRIRASGEGWIEAVSGRTGESIWRRTLAPGALEHAHDSTTAERYDRLCRPTLARVEGREVFLLVVGRRLHALEPATGDDAWPPVELGFEPRVAPRVLDLDGDGDSEALIHQLESQSSPAAGAGGRPGWSVVVTSPTTETVVTLSAISPRSGEALWEATLQPSDRTGALESASSPWLLPCDLDGDGDIEVVLCDGTFARGSSAARGLVRVLHGASGAGLWERQLTTWPLDRLAIGPDLDADGTRELVVSWYEYGLSGPGGATLVVATLSGADGVPRWLSRQPVPGLRSGSEPQEPLDWWHPDTDGWPLLVVPTEGGPGGQATVFVLSAASGELKNTIVGAHGIGLADVNGDGIRDLVYRVAPQGAPRLLVVQGLPSEPWRMLGDWRGAADVDGDGFTDLLGTESSSDGFSSIVVRSGLDRGLLWRNDHTQLVLSRPFLALPSPAGDLDGDGSPDLVFFEKGQGPVHETLAAYSGGDGRRLWSAGEIGLTSASGGGTYGSWSWELPALGWHDLDRDGRAEILAVHGRPGGGLALSALSGFDGRRLWQVDTVRGVLGLTPDPGPCSFEDLDGDGWADPVVWVPLEEDGPCELRALGGRDGRQLWTGDTVTVGSVDRLLWPRAEQGDIDGDGTPEVVLAVRGEHERGQGYRCDVVVLDGRDGRERWRWSRTGNAELLAPRLVDFRGDGRCSVCIATRIGPPRIVVLADGGEIRKEIELELSGYGLDETAQAWRHGDVDGDGREELLFISAGSLHAVGGDGESLWTWPIPSDPASARAYAPGPPRVVEILPGRGGAEAPTVVLWSDTTVRGLDGARGRPRWRCEVEWSPAIGMSSPPELDRLQAGEDLPPRFLASWPAYRADPRATAVRQAWPVDSAGAYSPLPTRPP